MSGEKTIKGLDEALEYAKSDSDLNEASYRGRKITWEIVDECIVIHDYQNGEAVNTVIPIMSFNPGMRAAGRIWRWCGPDVWQADDGTVFNGHIPCDHEGSWDAEWPWNPGARSPYCTRCGHSYPPKP